MQAIKDKGKEFLKKEEKTDKLVRIVE